MKHFALVVSVFLTLVSGFAAGQVPGRVQFDWGVNFDYIFHNEEFSDGSELFDLSGTLHAARLTPEAGVKVEQGFGSVTHRLMLGVDIFKQMGQGVQNTGLFKEMTLYYDVRARLKRESVLECTVGCFPRSRMRTLEYLGPFFSDRNLYLDNNIEGMLFKYSGRKLYAELALDWLGMHGQADDEPSRRERFQVLSSGRWNFAGEFELGWTGVFYHFANSYEVHNIVDNHSLNPWLGWRGRRTWFDEISVNAGVLYGYQWARDDEDAPRNLVGFFSRQQLSKWHLGLRNAFYFGPDLQPFLEGYGTDLYSGDPCYHTYRTDASWTDQLSVYYNPFIGRRIQLYVALNFHLGQGREATSLTPAIPVFRGWEQVFTVKFEI